MKTFKQWLLAERKVELVTCTKKMVKVPKGKSEKEFLAKRFVKGSKK